MLNAAQVGLFALLVGLFPAQVKQAVPAPVKQGSKLDVEHSDSLCQYLSPTECCEEMLKLASFRATKEHLPEQAAQILKIGCMVGKATLASESVCTNLATSRDFTQKEAKLLCAPKKVKGRCARNKQCAQCTKDLASLEYPGAHNACYAVTYMRRARSTPVVTVQDQPVPSRGDATVIVIPKRRKLLP